MTSNVENKENNSTATKPHEHEAIENTLKEDFENADFNGYLDNQPGYKFLDDGRRCKIIIKNVSHSFSEKAIRNLCSKFGFVCSVYKGRLYRNGRAVNYFVTFGQIDEAQKAIEHINRMNFKMRADFSISNSRRHESFKNPKHNENEQNEDEPVKINMMGRQSQELLFTDKYHFSFPIQQIGITLEFYKNSSLIKIDPSLNFFNEKALCDILTKEEDIKSLESATLSHKLSNFIWTYKISEKTTAKMEKFLSTSHGIYDEGFDLHSKKNEKFEKILGKYGNCNTCNNLTTRISKESEKFFCSIACQQKKEDDIGDTTNSIKDFQISLKEMSLKNNVVITAVISQNIVYVRSNDTATTTQYNKILQKVMVQCQDAPIILRAPNVGDVVGVQILDRVFYRAIVLKSVNYKTIRVALLDTGEVTNTKISELCKLPQELYFLPIFVRKIVLTDVPTDYVNMRAVKFLTKIAFQKKEAELLLKFDETFKIAQLYKKDRCLNNELRQIINMKELQESRYQAKKEYYTIKHIGTVPFTNLNSVPLVILDNSMLVRAELSCIAHENLGKLENLHRKIQYYGNSLELKDNHMYTPYSDEVCLFKLDNVWYRASCLETVGDQHPTMQSLDYGFFILVHISNIVKLPRKLLDKCYTYDFCIEDFDAAKTAVFANNIDKAKEMLAVAKIINAKQIIKKSESPNDHSLYIQSDDIIEAHTTLCKLQTSGDLLETIPEDKKRSKDENSIEQK